MLWADQKKNLKNQVCDYFRGLGADKSKLTEICGFLKELASIYVGSEELDDFRKPIDLDYAKSEIGSKFSLQHRQVLLRFASQLINLEIEAAKYLRSQRHWIDLDYNDFEEEMFEEIKPSAEVIVTPDHIIVNVLKYSKTIVKRLPNNGKYQGKGSKTWIYPSSMRPEIESLGFPVLKYPGIV